MADIAISNLRYFVTRVGSVDFFHLIYNYDSDIEPKVKTKDFIPDKDYLKNLFYSDIYFSFILDEISFYNFISDIQTISSLNFENNLQKEWVKSRKNPFLFCVFTSDVNIRKKIKSKEKNLLNETHLDSIKINLLEFPNNINEPKNAIEFYIKELQKLITRVDIFEKRGGNLIKNKPQIFNTI